jgi:hypothetical protein
MNRGKAIITPAIFCLMTPTLSLPSEIAQYLFQEADRQELSVESMALQLLIGGISAKQKQAEALDLI